MITSVFKQNGTQKGGPASGESRVTREAADIPSFRRSLPEARAELRRARRYEHPLAVLVLALDESGLEEASRRFHDPNDPWVVSRFQCTAHLVLGWILQDSTRETDLVSYVAEQHAYVVVMPETDAQGAMAAAERLREAFERRAALTLRTGHGCFPEGGFTIEDLFERACASAYADGEKRPGGEVRRASNG